MKTPLSLLSLMMIAVLLVAAISVSAGAATAVWPSPRLF
jgi:hypothetical protein